MKYREELEYIKTQCKRHKLLVAASILFFALLGAAYLYLRKPVFDAYASITLNEDKATPTSLTRQFSISNMLGGSGSVYNEVEALSSHTTMMNVVEELGLNTEYYVRTGPLKKIRAYPNAPIVMEYDRAIPDTLQCNIRFVAKGEIDGLMTVSAMYDGENIGKAEGQLPLMLSTDCGDFYFLRSGPYKKKKIKETIILRSYSTEAEMLLEKIKFVIPSKLANVVEMSYVSPNKQLATDMLSAVVDHYNTRGIDESRKRSAKRLESIDNRLLALSGELTESASEIKDFKEKNRITDFDTEAGYLFSKKANLEKEVFRLQTEYDVLENTINFLNNPENQYALLPSAASETNETASLKQYNLMIVERMQLVESVHPGNESLRRLESQIDAMRENVIASLKRTVASNEIQMAEVQASLRQTNAQLNMVPSQETVYRDIYRDQRLKEQLYVFLLEQREETAMSIQTLSERAKLVNVPYISYKMKAKNPAVIMFLFLLFGCLAMPVFYYVKLQLKQL